MKQYQWIILLFIIAGIPGTALWAQPKSLGVDLGEETLDISVHELKFLTHRELDRLHNGLTVHMILDLAIFEKNARKPFYRKHARFAFSYDLWEEKYSATVAPPDGRFASHLSAASAEKWCLQNMMVPLDTVSDRKSFVVQLECLIEENSIEENNEESPGLTMKGVIEFFSRKKSEDARHLKISSGLLHLNDLKQAGEAR